MPRKTGGDPLTTMEALLNKALQPGSNLFRYMQADLLGDGEAAAGKPDAKPLKEVLAVLQQLRELKGEKSAQEVRVVFADAAQEAWSE